MPHPDTARRIRHNDLLLLCDGRKYLLLENKGDAELINLTVVKEAHRADLPTHKLGADAPGRVRSSHDARRSSVEQTDWHEAEEREFLLSAAVDVDCFIAAARRDAQRLIVIAPARALGILRAGYSPAVRRIVVAEIAKDYVNEPVTSIEAHLKSMA
jgi:protein required for attachment to host cells